MDPRFDVDPETEYVCPVCNLVHWKATPREITCDATN